LKNPFFCRRYPPARFGSRTEFTRPPSETDSAYPAADHPGHLRNGYHIHFGASGYFLCSLTVSAPFILGFSWMSIWLFEESSPPIFSLKHSIESASLIVVQPCICYSLFIFFGIQFLSPEYVSGRAAVINREFFYGFDPVPSPEFLQLRKL